MPTLSSINARCNVETTLFSNDLFTAEKSRQIYEATCAHIAKTGAAEEIRRFASGYSLTHRILPERTDEIQSGHQFPWFESEADLQISFNLASFGYYKQAHGALRSALDLGLLLVYWSMNEDGHSAFKQWLRSHACTPFASQVWKRVSSHPNFQAFQDSFLTSHSYHLEEQFKSVSEVGNFVHTRGAKFSNVLPFPGTSVRIPGQRFSEDAFDAWQRRFAATVRFLVVCYLVRYPIGTVRYDWGRKFGIDIPAFGGLPDNWISMLEELVSQDVFRAISDLAKTDPHVAEVMEWVKSLPDLSDDAINDQVFEQQKSLVKDMGLGRWLEMVNKWCDTSEDKTGWEKLRSRVVEWAKNNELDGPAANQALQQMGPA
jgi:hypothetical protein